MAPSMVGMINIDRHMWFHPVKAGHMGTIHLSHTHRVAHSQEKALEYRSRPRKASSMRVDESRMLATPWRLGGKNENHWELQYNLSWMLNKHTYGCFNWWFLYYSGFCILTPHRSVFCSSQCPCAAVWAHAVRWSVWRGGYAQLQRELEDQDFTWTLKSIPAWSPACWPNTEPTPHPPNWAAW